MLYDSFFMECIYYMIVSFRNYRLVNKFSDIIFFFYDVYYIIFIKII